MKCRFVCHAAVMYGYACAFVHACVRVCLGMCASVCACICTCPCVRTTLCGNVRASPTCAIPKVACSEHECLSVSH